MQLNALGMSLRAQPVPHGSVYIASPRSREFTFCFPLQISLASVTLIGWSLLYDTTIIGNQMLPSRGQTAYQDSCGARCSYSVKINNGPHSRTVLKNKFVLESYLRRFYEDCGIHEFFSYPGFFLGKNKSYEHSGVPLSTFQCQVGMVVLSSFVKFNQIHYSEISVIFISPSTAYKTIIIYY